MCVFLGFCVFEDVQETEWEEKNSVGTCETVNNQEFVCFCMQAGFDEYCEESSNCAITSSSDKWQGFQLNHLRLRSIAYDSRHVLKNRKLKIREVKKDVYASVTVSHSRLFIFPVSQTPGAVTITAFLQNKQTLSYDLCTWGQLQQSGLDHSCGGWIQVSCLDWAAVGSATCSPR